MKHTLVFHLIGLSKKFQRAIGLKSPSLPLSYSQTAALLVIDSLPKASQIEIARRLHLQPASVVTLIDELEKLMLVERQTIPGNRRTYQICLLDSGKSLITKIKKQSQNVENIVKKQLSPQEFTTLKSIVAKLSHGLDHAELDKNKNKGKGGEK